MEWKERELERERERERDVRCVLCAQTMECVYCVNLYAECELTSAYGNASL